MTPLIEFAQGTPSIAARNSNHLLVWSGTAGRHSSQKNRSWVDTPRVLDLSFFQENLDPAFFNKKNQWGVGIWREWRPKAQRLGRWRTAEIVKQQTNETPSNKKQTQNDAMLEAGERISKPSFLASMLNFGGVTQTFVTFGNILYWFVQGLKKPWWRDILETQSYPTSQVEKSEGNAKLQVLLIFLFQYEIVHVSRINKNTLFEFYLGIIPLNIWASNFSSENSWHFWMWDFQVQKNTIFPLTWPSFWVKFSISCPAISHPDSILSNKITPQKKKWLVYSGATCFKAILVNSPWLTMEHEPWMKIHFLFKFQTFQLHCFLERVFSQP